LHGPLKAAFNSECNLHWKRSAHEEIMYYELAQLFNKAFLKVNKMEKENTRLRAADICF
jgi:hypothetical protein